MATENPLHTYQVEHTYREGWGVEITPVWEGDEEPERVADIDVHVVRIAPDTCRWFGGAFCVALGDNCGVPVESFRELDDLWEDDTHDLRTRWFATEGDARAHAERVEKSWANPNPWEVFVKLY